MMDLVIGEHKTEHKKVVLTLEPSEVNPKSVELRANGVEIIMVSDDGILCHNGDTDKQALVNMGFKWDVNRNWLRLI